MGRIGKEQEVGMNGLNEYIGKAIELAAAVDYANGSVVSKTILDKKTGTLTLFAFDKGQGLSEHTSPYDATVQILDGEGELTVGGTSHVGHGAPFFKGRCAVQDAVDHDPLRKRGLEMVSGTAYCMKTHGTPFI
jgi:hypothetical protein